MKPRLLVLVAATLLIASREVRAQGTSLGVGVGYVKASRVDATLVFSGDLRFHLSRGFAFEPELSYWKKSQTTGGITVSVDDLEFGINALLVLPAGRNFQLFAGAGAAFHHITGSLGILRLPGVSNSITKGGLDLQAGIDLKVSGQVSFFLLARHDWVLGLDGADPGRLDQTKLVGGFRMRF
jgi:opacity protein-like surface antigen